MVKHMHTWCYNIFVKIFGPSNVQTCDRCMTMKKQIAGGKDNVN